MQKNPLAKPVVFLGASLSRETARPILDADFRPPLRAGDLDALPDGSKAAIIDGLLDPSVRLPTAEAVRALDRGLQLWGAASTGALLATRLETRGMTGVGRIFFFLRSLQEDGEDLITVLQRETDAKPVTVPLIHIVLSLLDQEKIKPDQVADLLRRLRSIPLTERYFDTISDPLARMLRGEFVTDGCFSIFNYKEQDALQLLHLLRPSHPEFPSPTATACQPGNTSTIERRNTHGRQIPKIDQKEKHAKAVEKDEAKAVHDSCSA